MSNIKLYIIILIALLISGCYNNTCPKNYKNYDGRCYTIENVNPDIKYSCNRGGELNGTKCIITEEYDCSMTFDKNICTTTQTYLAEKSYICPDGYDLNNTKCSKIKYLK